MLQSIMTNIEHGKTLKNINANVFIKNMDFIKINLKNRLTNNGTIMYN